MSLLKKVGKVIGGAARIVAPAIGAVNPLGGLAAAVVGTLGARTTAQTTAISPAPQLAPLPTARMSLVAAGPQVMPGIGPIPTMGSLPGIATRVLPQLGRLGGVAVGMGIRGVSRVASSAARYCKANPGWCATIGGVAAVEALINSGQLPVHRQRRARGLTGREMRSFRKVHRVLSKFCAPRMRIRRAKSCR